MIKPLIIIFPLRKEEGTVAQLMRHELGLPLFSRSLHPQDFTRENIRQGLSIKDVYLLLTLGPGATCWGRWWQGVSCQYQGCLIVNVFSVGSSCSILTPGPRSNHLGEVVAGERYAWAPGSRREYHVISRGVIANEAGDKRLTISNIDQKVVN